MRSMGFGGLYPGMVGMSRGRRSGGASMAGVTKDATSNIYCPASSTEWTTTKNVASLPGTPSFLWLMQDTASPESEVFGTGATLATSGAAGTFAAANAGWSRKGWKSAGDGVSARLLSTSAALPNPTSTSALMLAYVAILATPAAQRQALFAIGGTATTGARVEINTTPSVVGFDDSNTATGTANLGTVVRPYVIKYDHTNSVCTIYTDQEHVSPTFAAGSGQALTIGYVNATSPSMWCGYVTLFTGAAAELSDAQVRTLLQTLGWTVAW